MAHTKLLAVQSCFQEAVKNISEQGDLEHSSHNNVISVMAAMPMNLELCRSCLSALEEFNESNNFVEVLINKTGQELIDDFNEMIAEISDAIESGGLE